MSSTRSPGFNADHSSSHSADSQVDHPLAQNGEEGERVELADLLG
jgi:hypothetical protein